MFQSYCVEIQLNFRQQYVNNYFIIFNLGSYGKRYLQGKLLGGRSYKEKLLQTLFLWSHFDLIEIKAKLYRM